jgi:hypothetical protein
MTPDLLFFERGSIKSIMQEQRRDKQKRDASQVLQNYHAIDFLLLRPTTVAKPAIVGAEILWGRDETRDKEVWPPATRR